MKNIIEKKKTIFIILFMVVIGGTLAFFTSTVSIPNIFTSTKYEITTTDGFTSPSNWTPGDVTPKTIVTTNNSSVPIRVRLAIEESWTDNNDEELSLDENGVLAAIINLDNRQDWIYENGFYYYKYDLDPGEDTSSFIKSVTFNEDIVGEYICTTSGNSEQCVSASDTYQDATYSLDVSVETTLASNYLESWGLSRAPRRVAPTYCTYNGELVQGAEYVNGDYTYRYMQRRVATGWRDIEDEGWGVYLTDPASLDPVTSPLCTYINNVPIIATSFMFSNSLTPSVDTSSFDTSEVTDFSGMFYRTSLESLDISNLETGNATTMMGMFFHSNIANIDLSSFDTSNVTSMARMFRDSTFEKLDLSSFDTSKVTNMQEMFSTCLATSIDVSSFDTANVGRTDFMFYKTHIDQIDLSHFNTSNVTDMSGMFEDTMLTDINVSNFDTSKVTIMSAMFARSKVRVLDLSSFDTSLVTYMGSMFEDASFLQTIYVSNKWNNNSVTTSTDMFKGCTSLSGYNSSNVGISMANTNGGYFTLKP